MADRPTLSVLVWWRTPRNTARRVTVVYRGPDRADAEAYADIWRRVRSAAAVDIREDW